MPRNGYQRTILEAIPGLNDEELEAIEDCMRHVIFHSTLDWQTHDQLVKGALDAYIVLHYEEAQIRIARATPNDPDEYNRRINVFCRTGRIDDLPPMKLHTTPSPDIA